MCMSGCIAEKCVYLGVFTVCVCLGVFTVCACPGMFTVCLYLGVFTVCVSLGVFTVYVSVFTVCVCLGVLQESRDVITPLQLELDYDIPPNVPGISMGCDICPIRNIYSRTKEIRQVCTTVVFRITLGLFLPVSERTASCSFYVL